MKINPIRKCSSIRKQTIQPKRRVTFSVLRKSLLNVVKVFASRRKMWRQANVDWNKLSTWIRIICSINRDKWMNNMHVSGYFACVLCFREEHSNVLRCAQCTCHKTKRTGIRTCDHVTIIICIILNRVCVICCCCRCLLLFAVDIWAENRTQYTYTICMIPHLIQFPASRMFQF